MNHLSQLRIKVPFIRDNEKELTDNPTKATSEIYITVLIALLRKSLNIEVLCDSVIKTLITFVNKNPGIRNQLFIKGCPRILLQIMKMHKIEY